jgi:hypothetical protein
MRCDGDAIGCRRSHSGGLKALLLLASAEPLLLLASAEIDQDLADGVTVGHMP